MNPVTQARYERIGKIVYHMAAVPEITDFDRLLIDDLLSVNRHLSNTIDLLKHLQNLHIADRSPQTIEEIAAEMHASDNTVRALVRSLEAGGLKFITSIRPRNAGEGPAPKEYIINLKPSALTSLLDEF